MSWRFAVTMQCAYRVGKRFAAIDGVNLSAYESDGKTELRYVREIIFGKRRTQQYWELTTDPETLPKNATWCVMTHIENLKYDRRWQSVWEEELGRVWLEAEQERVGMGRESHHELCSD